MILLPTGKLLVFPVGDKTYLWNPADNTWKHVPATFGDIHCAGHVTLSDGTPFVVGGVDVTPFVGIKVAATFDYVTETWTTRTPMKYARWYPTVTTLADGRVLAANGTDENKAKVLIPEVYDPATNTWTELTGASRNQPIYSFMYQLPNGKVYEAAPKSGTAYLDVGGAGAWTPGPTSGWDNSPAGCCSESGAMYGIGKIIRSGGGDPAHARTGVIDTTAASPTWRETESMAFPRRRHNMVIGADGSVFAIGGTRVGDDASQAVLAAERWDPVTEQWDTMAAMSVPRMYHSAAILLPDGRIVAAGGDNPSATAKLSAQIYSPPYLFVGARPVIGSAPASASYGSTFEVGVDFADIASVALIRSGAPTHATDMNQRYVPLSFAQLTATSLSVSAPSDGNVAPPGKYLLVVENANGVPSVARWIQIGGEAAPPPPQGAPTAGFSASPTTGTAPVTVSFTDTSTGTPTEWAWDFQNDGVVDSTVQSPRFEYTTPGTYTVKLVVRNASGTDDEVKVGYVNVGSGEPSSSTVTFAPEADARVQEANASTNFGTSFLRADGAADPDVESYLRFTVVGVPRAASARLRIYATSGTGNGPAVYTATNAWSESGITWANRPARTTTGTDDKGAIGANTWVEWDVSSLVPGEGTYTFVLATNTTDGVNLNSREATSSSLRPQLVVTPASQTPSPPTAEFTATPTTGVAPLTVAFTDRSTGALSWAWDFQNDDGFETTERNPMFTYTQPGTYTVRLQVENDVGGDEEIKTDYITVTAPSPPGTTVTLNPVADAHVKSDMPTSNTGTSTNLRADAVPEANAYLKFDVTGLSGPPRSARLRLFVNDASTGGPRAYSAGNGWTEMGITWNNAPPINGGLLASAASAPLNTWIELDVTSAIAGNGTFTLVVKGGSSDNAYFNSRQAASNRPQLVVTP